MLAFLHVLEDLSDLVKCLRFENIAKLLVLNDSSDSRKYCDLRICCFALKRFEKVKVIYPTYWQEKGRRPPHSFANCTFESAKIRSKSIFRTLLKWPPCSGQRFPFLNFIKLKTPLSSGEWGVQKCLNKASSW